MYAYLKGTLEYKFSDHIIIENNGIGYNVFYPVARIASLPPIGSSVTVYTYTSVREDALQLYGFDSMDDKELFCTLISVSGVGPKAGMSLLSEMSASQIRLAIISGDTKALSKAQGIAKKTAERIIVDLKAKMNVDEDSLSVGALSTDVPVSEDENEAVQALVALGYPAKDARGAVAKAIADKAEGTLYWLNEVKSFKLDFFDALQHWDPRWRME